MAARTQVVFITDGIFPHAVGGMQRHSALLLEALAKTGKVDLVVVHPHNLQVFDSALGIQEVRIPFSFDGFYIGRLYAYSRQVAQVVRRYPHALVYAQGLCVLAGLPFFGRRVVVNPHGLEPFQAITSGERLKAWPFRMLERYQFWFAARVVSLGGNLTTILRRETPNANRKVVVLPNAVNPGPKPTRTFDAPVLNLLFVGRFAFNKGINILMQAVKELNAEGYQNRFVFHLVGKGPLFDAYNKEYNFENVKFLGFADDDRLMALYQENDLFVFPTRFEGMPTVVLEAMAAAMPVVVSDTGATAELVQADNGFLIPKNDVGALKQALLAYLNLTPAARKQLSDASYRKVTERFTWEQVANQHVQLFESMRAKP